MSTSLRDLEELTRKMLAEVKYRQLIYCHRERRQKQYDTH